MLRSMFRLDSKVALVTGAGSGIGASIAETLAQAGAFVFVTDVTAASGKNTVERIQGAGGKAGFIPLDVTNEAECATAARTVLEHHGRLDILVNNAGVYPRVPLLEMRESDWDHVLDINLKGVLFGAQAAHPWLKASAPGSCLLNTGSAAGIYGTPGASVYSATKFGVRALTECLDAEWAPDGIKVCDLMPGFIDTPLIDMNPNQQSNEHIRGRVQEAGLEITPVGEVAEAAWKAVHGTDLHNRVGKTAHRLAFAARWMPGRLRKMTRSQLKPLGGH